MESTLEKPVVKVSEVKELLSKGYTRDNKHKNYNPEIGCLTDHYGLSSEQVNLIFAHEKLKGVRTKVPKVQEFILEDDEAATITSDTLSMTESISEFNPEEEV